MMNSVILLSHSNSTRNATRKIFETLYIDPPFLVRNLPEAPAEIDVNEFIVSEAMKLACNDDERVLILDIDKKDVIEKDILCDKFDSLVRFLPHPFLLPDVVSMKNSYSPDDSLACEKRCTVFGSQCKPENMSGNVYAGGIIHRICHDLSHLPEKLDYTKADLKKFLSIIPATKAIDIESSPSKTSLFVPAHERNLVASFLKELKELQKIAEAVTKFEDKFETFWDAESFNDFPFLGGD